MFALLIEAILKAAFSLKLAWITATTLVLAIGGWSTSLYGAVETSGGVDPITTAIPAAALTATSGALVWVVKQIAGGNLVHRDTALAEAKLTETAATLTRLSESSLKREATLHDLLVRNQKADK